MHHSLAQHAAWLALTIAYVQNSFLAFDFTQLLRILKDYPAARLAIVMFIVTAPPPKGLNTMPQPTDDISRALAYALDPVLWTRDVVGWRPDPWQERLLHSAATQLALCCARQVGKSSVVAVRLLFGQHRAARRARRVEQAEHQAEDVALPGRCAFFG